MWLFTLSGILATRNGFGASEKGKVLNEYSSAFLASIVQEIL